MQARGFQATCQHAPHRFADVTRFTFHTRETFDAHARKAHKAARQGSGRVGGREHRPLGVRVAEILRAAARRPAARAFDPALGDVGSWVTFDHAGVTYEGQVWAVVRGGAHPRVIVADGRNYWTLSVSELRAIAPAADALELDLHNPAA